MPLDTTKDILEIIYFIAFIVLTYLIVIYARKTYRLQTEKAFQLLCKISVQEVSIRSYNFNLEVYNRGNDVAKQIDVKIWNAHLTTIDFIKPEESYIIPIGEFGSRTGGRIYLYSGGELKHDVLPTEVYRSIPILVQLVINCKTYEFTINTDILYLYREYYTSTLGEISCEISVLSNIMEEGLKEMNNQLKQISSGIDNILQKLN